MGGRGRKKKQEGRRKEGRSEGRMELEGGTEFWKPPSGRLAFANDVLYDGE